MISPEASTDVETLHYGNTDVLISRKIPKVSFVSITSRPISTIETLADKNHVIQMRRKTLSNPFTSSTLLTGVQKSDSEILLDLEKNTEVEKSLQSFADDLVFEPQKSPKLVTPAPVPKSVPKPVPKPVVPVVASEPVPVIVPQPSFVPACPLISMKGPSAFLYLVLTNPQGPYRSVDPIVEYHREYEVRNRCNRLWELFSVYQSQKDLNMSQEDFVDNLRPIPQTEVAILVLDRRWYKDILRMKPEASLGVSFAASAPIGISEVEWDYAIYPLAATMSTAVKQESEVAAVEKSLLDKYGLTLSGIINVIGIGGLIACIATRPELNKTENKVG